MPISIHQTSLLILFFRENIRDTRRSQEVLEQTFFQRVSVWHFDECTNHQIFIHSALFLELAIKKKSKWMSFSRQQHQSQSESATGCWHQPILMTALFSDSALMRYCLNFPFGPRGSMQSRKDQFPLSSIQSPLRSFGVIFHQSWHTHPGIQIRAWIRHKERAKPAEWVRILLSLLWTKVGCKWVKMLSGSIMG